MSDHIIAALIGGTLGLYSALAMVAKGRREQVWEPDHEARPRRIENDIVWPHTFWINLVEGQPETPHAGIARLHKELR